MRPLKLKLTAFGPYRDTEVIDFNELEDNKLFVISGNTGSGKTTIFDGISFALYGSASGEDRDNYTMLRSDFADDDTHTAVELEFALNDRRFRVLRQLGHIKAGNKSRTGERYEFFEYIDGEEVPAVDRQMVSEIDLKIESLIGLTQDQFKQIVMLPQGEFRKLLTSSTENKEAILRRLFKTEPYKYISEYLKERKNNAEKLFNSEKQAMDHYIQNINSTLVKRDNSNLFEVLEEPFYNVNQVLTALDEEITYYNEKINQDENKFKAASETYDKEQDQYHKAQSLNERFADLEKKQSELEHLNNQASEFERKEKQAESARQASQIKPYENQYNELEKETVAKKVVMNEAKKAQTLAEESLSKRTVLYEQQEKKQLERENLSRELDRLKDFLPTVKDIDKKQKELEVLKNVGQKTITEKEKVEEDLLIQHREIEAENKQINEADLLVAKLPEKERTLNQMRERAGVLQEFIKYQNTNQTLTKQIEEEKKGYEKAKEEYTTSEKLWLNNQASVIATHLHDGEACPVCGSESHPNKAISDEEMITKEQLELLKQEFNKLDNHYRNLIAEKNTNDSHLKQAIETVKGQDINIDDVTTVQNQLINEGKQLKTDVGQLEDLRKELVTKKENQATKQASVIALEESKKEIDEKYLAQKTSYETSYAVFKHQIDTIPEEVRVLSVLEKRIIETENKKIKSEQTWKEVQDKLQQAKEKRTTAKSDLSHASKQVDEANKKRDQARERFDENISKAEFNSEEAYRLAKMSHESLTELTEAIKVYNEKKVTLTQQVTELNQALKNNQRIDLEILQEQLTKSKKVYESALNNLNQSKHLFEAAGKLKNNIEAAHELVVTQERQLGIIADLHDVIRGQNSKKISFERYLQIAYLEQIIDAANYRLETLSNGQFLLMRSDRQESHGRQSGLALDVYDGQTGQTRDVKTLSGGEKFNASLCLALGMSDVIQSFQGNISIKTMFIDEGFGSLDEESLHKSIDILIDLQESGRMIGVISHVEELKNIFPAVLEVKKSQEGHSCTKFIIK